MLNPKSFLFVLTFFLSLTTAFAQDARVWYVSADGLSSASGSSWGAATTFHNALSSAAEGDSLFLKAGTYIPNRAGGNLVTDPRDATFQIPHGLLVYGGFEGTEATLANRDMTRIATANETIIEGNIGDKESNDDNIKGLLFVDVAESATLDGLTVARGNNSTNGAGLFVGDEAEVTIRHCRFIENRAASGGAIFSDVNGMPTIANSHFENNTSTSTAAGNGGGAIYADEFAVTTITTSTFESNTSLATGISSGGGAIHIEEDGMLRVTGSTFEGNSSRGAGGAIYVLWRAATTITTSTFEENTSNSGGSAVSFSTPGASTVSHCSFLRNRTMGTGNGTLFSFGGGPTHVSNSLFVGNEANTGAALFHDNVGTGGSFVNNTAYGNTDRNRTGLVATVFVNGAWVIANNLVYGNDSGNEMLVRPSGATVAHNLVEGDDVASGGGTAVTRVGAVMGTALFASTDPTDPNYLRLLPASTGVDAGNNNYIDGDADAFEASDATTDLAGNPRIVNTTIDVGAYEVATVAQSLNVSNAGGERALVAVPEYLPAAGGMHTFHVSYTGASAGGGVMIAETSDVDEILTLTTTAVTSSPAEVSFTLTPNTTTSAREAVLTFTLDGSSPAVSQEIRLVQGKSGSGIVYVAADGDEDADGGTWARATTLHSAIDNYVFGDTLFVKAGTYTPRMLNGGVADDLRDGTYVLPDSISIYGGFAGTETSLEGRAMDLIATTNETLIEGNIGDMDDNEDNIKRLFTIPDSESFDSDVVTLDGLTIARGYNTTRGAGLYAGTKSLVNVRHVRFLGHNSRDGAAIYLGDKGVLGLTSNVLEGNRSTNDGGAIYVAKDGAFSIKTSTFEDNSATNDGGAIYAGEVVKTRLDAKTGVFLGTNFRNGEFIYGELIYLGTFNITGSTFEDNRAAFGGAVYVDKGGLSTITSSTFEGNTLSAGNEGIAIYIASDAEGEIARSSFLRNIGPGEASGTLYASSAATLDVLSSLFVGNSAESGSTLFSIGAWGTFVNNTVYGNTDRTTTLGTISLEGMRTSRWWIGNNIIYGNARTNESQVELSFSTAAGKLMRHNLVEGNKIRNAPPARLGEVPPPASASLVFASLESMDPNFLRPLASFAGVDRGDNSYLNVGIGDLADEDPRNRFDVAGSARIINGTVDLGAYEAPLSASRMVVSLYGARGTRISPDTIFVPSSGGTDSLSIQYAGTGTMGVSIVETSDPNNIITLEESSVSASPGKVKFSLTENTTGAPREVVLTFTLTGSTPPLSQAIRFIQGRNRIIYVTTDGDRYADGGSWLAATTFNSALENCVGGDTIFMKAGIYTPRMNGRDVAENPRNATYLLQDSVVIYGGFAGTELSLGDRDIALVGTTNETLIEGNIESVIGSTESSTDDMDPPNIGNLFTLAAGDTATLDGLTVARAYSNGNGGGLYAGRMSQLTLRHCKFVGNRANNGAGVYVDFGGRLTVMASTFEENTLGGGSGAAIYFGGTTFTIANSSFLRNSNPDGYQRYDGALYATSSSTMHVFGSLFVGNVANDGSVMSTQSSTNGSFVNNTVYGNEERYSNSSPINILGTSTSWVVANNIIYGNVARDELFFSGSGNKTMAHNLIEADDIGNAPTRIGGITPPSTAAVIFESLEPGDPNYLRLLPASVGVDGGNNNYIDGDADAFVAADAMGLTDLAGNNRIVNTTVDLGAYEAPSSVGLFVGITGAGSSRTSADTISLGAAGGTATLTVRYTGGVSSVIINETSDPNNMLSVGSSAVSSSGAQVMLTVAASSNPLPQEAVLTFTLQGPDPAVVETIRFIQKRGGSTVVHVATDGDGDSEGLSWATATTFQSALNNYKEGDTLFVKAGSYSPRFNSGGGRVNNSEATYVLPDGIIIYGGFVGTEESPEDRVMSSIATTNETIMEGRISSYAPNNIRQIFKVENEDVVILDGLTVARGYSAPWRGINGTGLGGGTESEVTVRHCKFVGHLSHDGAGIFIDNDGSLTVISCTFEDNQGNSGGGIFMDDDGTLNVTGSTFRNNRSVHNGGGSGGAAIYINNEGTTMIENSTFEGNSAQSHGGAIYMDNDGTITVNGSTFQENTLVLATNGAAICLRENIMATITRTSFLNNSSPSASFGTVYFATGGTLNISQSLFFGNSVGSGSVVYSFGSTGQGTFINNTLYGNQDRTTTFGSLSLEKEASTWVVANNLFFGSMSSFDLSFRSTINKTMAHNVLLDSRINATSKTRTGAIEPPSSPLVIFESVDPEDDEFLRLIAGSVATDGGNNNYIDGDADAFVPADATGLTDLGGNARIINTTVDVGAYEAPAATRYVVVDVSGTNVSRTKVDTVFLPSSAVSATLNIRYAGTDATNVSITETSDPGNMLVAAMNSASSSPATVSLAVAENTGVTNKEAVLTFTVAGVSPALTQVIRFIQTRERQVVYVATDGDEDADGAYWESATTLHAALENYTAGDTIFVKGGIYTPEENTSRAVPSDPRDATFVLPTGVVMYGGFVGTEIQPEDRLRHTITGSNASVMEGNIGGDTREDNIKRLLTLAVNTTATLDGIVVRGGYAAADGSGLGAAAGCNLTLRRCRFIQCRSSSGGAVYMETTATLTVTNSSFESNYSSWIGGAIAVAGGTATINSSTFSHNHAVGNGSGIGAGAIYSEEGLTVSGSTFRGNSADDHGGAIAIPLSQALTVTSSIFESNVTSRTHGAGSAIYAAGDAAVNVSDCSFLRNNATRGSSQGALWVGISSPSQILRNLFVGNSANSSSAAYFANGSTGSFVNNTVYGNRSKTNDGGAVNMVSTSTDTWLIANNLIYGNTTSAGQYELSFGNAGGKTLANNLIQGNDIRNAPTSRTMAATAPSSAYAVFESIDPESPNFLRLRLGSVGIDAGNNAYIDGNADAFEVADTLGLNDLGGNKRIFNSTATTSGNIDIGAYEGTQASDYLVIDIADVSAGAQRTRVDTVLLDASGGTATLRVRYAGTDVTALSITETSDPNNILSAAMPSSTTSPTEVTLTAVANTTSMWREAVMTFGLTGATPALTRSIRFMQRKGAKAIVYVATDGDPFADGTNFERATTFQSALDNYVDEDTIFMKAGSYTPTMSGGVVAGDPRDATYVLPDNLMIYGGFAGTETSLAARDMTLIATTNATIIEGNIGSSDANTDNVKSLFNLPENNEATLDGLTVARGYSGVATDGSGVLAGESTQLTIRHCRFIGGQARFGGAISMPSTSGTLTINSTAFEDNNATSGAAVYSVGTLIITSSTFNRNISARNGGAVYQDVSGTPVTINSSTFERNRAADGGALYLEGSGALTINSSTFNRNTTSSHGGAIFLNDERTLTINSSTFDGNSVSLNGGAIFVDEDATLNVESSTFERNGANNGAAIYVQNDVTLSVTGSSFEENALTGGGEGLAIYLRNNSTGTIASSSFLRNRGEEESSGTLFAFTGVTLHVSNSLFVGNFAEDGSTIFSFGSGGSFVNNTVYANRDRTTTLGTLSLEDGTATWVIANNVIYGNATANQGQYELSMANATNKTLAHNLIGGNDIKNAPTMRIGAITAPADVSDLFESLDPGDLSYLHLIPTSAGVDAGNNDYIDGNADAFEAADATTDLGGGTRIVNTTVDVGAYEVQGEATASGIGVFDVATGRGLSPMGNYLSNGGGRIALRVVYEVTGATGVTVTEGSDPNDIVSLVMSSVSASRSQVTFDIDENTSTTSRDISLTFTLNNVTPAQARTIVFTQKRRPARVFVAQDGTPDADGMTWATATTLNKALSASASVGDTVFVKAGTYSPTDRRGVMATDPRHATYVLLDRMSVYGGFAGTEMRPEDRNMSLIATTNATILEGNIGDMSSSEDNIRSFFSLGSEERASLDGLTIARTNGGTTSAISLGDYARLKLSSCRFIGNRNTAGGGAIRSTGNARLGIHDCLFEENESSGQGGAIYAGDWNTLTLTGSRFEGNRLSGGDEGIAIYFDSNGTGRISSCSFLRNRGSYLSSGTLFASLGARLHVSSSIFVGNSADDGSTLFSLGSGGSFVNNTVYGNRDERLDFGTISIEGGESDWVIANNIIYGNDKLHQGRFDLALADARNKTLAHNLIRSRDIKNAPERIGAITFSPFFNAAELFASLDPTDANYLQLLAGSVGVDAGNNDYIDGNTRAFVEADAMGMTDLAGGPRIFNRVVDLGAYERQFDRVSVTTIPEMLTDLPSSGGTLTAIVTLSGGATGYRVDLARARFTTSSTPGGMGDARITLTYERNARTLPREDTVIFVPVGSASRAFPDTLFLSQLGFIPTGQSVTLDPNRLENVPAAGDMRTISVTFGRGATGYTTSGVPDWVSVPAMTTDGNLVITINENTTTLVRTGEVVFTPTGGEGDALEDRLFISQQAAPQMISLSPDNLMDVPGAGATRTISVTLSGGATGYTTSGAADWVTVPAMGMSGDLMITLEMNASRRVRTNEVIFTPTGGMGEAIPATLTISQLGTMPTGPAVTLEPNTLSNVPAAGAMRTIRVMLSGGATGYSIPESGRFAPASWVTVPTMATDGTIVITIGENTTTAVREDSVIFMPTGVTGDLLNDTLAISQRPTPQTITLNPDNLMNVPAVGATRTVRVTFGGGATGYTTSGAPDWVTVPAMATNGTLMITITGNTSRRVRRDSVIFTPTGGMGDANPDTLAISQLGVVPPGRSVTLDPNMLNDVPAAGGMRTVVVMLAGGATGFTTTGADAWVTVPAMGAGGDLVVTLAENTTTSARKDTVFFVPTGGTGEITRDSLFITQLAASTSPISYGIPEDVFADVRVVNPVSNDLIIYGLPVSVDVVSA